MHPAVWTYFAYLFVSVCVTVFVGRTLHRNGRIFLVDAMRGNEALADSVNHLLVVGFYLINIGYVAVTLRYGQKPTTFVEGIEFFSTKIGIVLLVLGVMHFTNVYVLSKVRRRALQPDTPHPLHPPVRQTNASASTGDDGNDDIAGASLADLA